MCVYVHTHIQAYNTHGPISGEIKRDITVHVDPFSEFVDISRFLRLPSFHHSVLLFFPETQTRRFTGSCSVLESGKMKFEELGYFQVSAESRSLVFALFLT